MKSSYESFVSGFNRRCGYLHHLKSPLDVIKFYFDWLVRNSKLFYKLFGGKIVKINLNDYDAPLYIRLGSSDGFVIEEVFFTAAYHPALDHLPKNVTSILDLGANAGYTAFLFSSHSREAKVVAVEAAESNIEIARRNLESFDNALVLHGCVSGSEKQVYFDMSGVESSHRIIDHKTSGSQMMTSITVPQILEQYRLASQDDCLDLLKCDVEGAESEIFENCKDWIGSVKIIIIELHGSYTEKRFKNDLVSNGWKGSITELKSITGENFLLCVAS